MIEININWILLLGLIVKFMNCASFVTNLESHSNEIICNQESEKYIEENGKVSSFILDLHPGTTQNICRRQFRAPDSHGFFVKLTKFNKNTNIMRLTNRSYSCPLHIFSTNEPLSPPWRLDPCKLEETDNHVSELVRLMPQRINLLWKHDGNIPAYKLSFTVYGRGETCNASNKHPCLKLEEVLICIASDLLCDGNNNCPIGQQYNSDENSELCKENQGGNFLTNFKKNYNLFEHLSTEVFKNLFISERDLEPSETVTLENPETRKVTNYSKDSVEIHFKRKHNLNKGLSKYGPWGYLILGMLLCGSLLIFCGLWECCCRRYKPSNTATQSETISNIMTSIPHDAPSVESVPPNYDELDPPPPYSVLFPTLYRSSLKTESANLNSNNTETIA